MTNPYRDLELLAPAGNMACLHAAVQAGANAVYLGCEDFNARRGADNFTLENLSQACDYAHLRGVSIYMTVNVAVLPKRRSGRSSSCVRHGGEASMRSSFKTSASRPK